MSTITLYKLPQNILGKNNQYDSWITYLNAVSSDKKSVITDFMYQKIDLELTIKINLSQANVSYNFGFNYLQIAQGESGSIMNYFYFIKKVKPLAQSTLELELHMDVLNTYQFTKTLTTGNTYTLLPSTLILREHKNRMEGVGSYANIPAIISDEVRTEFLDVLADGGAYYESNIEATLMISVSDLVDLLSNNPAGSQEILWKTYFVRYLNGTYEGCFKISFDGTNWIDTSAIGFEGNYLIKWTSYDSANGNEYWDYSKFFSTFSYLFIKVEVADPENVSSVSAVQDFGTTDSSFYYVQNTLIPFMVSRIQQRVYVKWKRIIDKYPENINPQLFKRYEQQLLDGGNSANWYMLYQNANAVTSGSDTEADYVNPVKLMFVSSDTQLIPASSSTAVAKVVEASDKNILPAMTNQQEALFVRYKDRDGTTTPIVTIGSTTYTIVDTQAISSYGANQYTMIMFRRAGNNDNFFTAVYGYKIHYVSASEGTEVVIDTLATNVSSFTIKGFNYIQRGGILWNNMYNANSYFTRYNTNSGLTPVFIGSGITTGTGTNTPLYTKRFDELDLTNPKNVKLINVPYSPVGWNVTDTIDSLPDGYAINSSMNLIEVTSLAFMNFKRTIYFSDVMSPLSVMYVEHSTQALSHTDVKSKDYESKLFHSEFYMPKFVYDSYSFTFQLELVDRSLLDVFKNDTGEFYVTYVVSKNLASRFMFTFPQYVCGQYQTQDYNNILIIDRNNEVTLFTNEYMNYLKLGYNFDTKSIQKRNEMNWLGVGLSMAGAIASFVSSVYTGGAGVVGGVSLMTTAIGGTTRAIAQAQESDRSMSQKLNQLALQSTSVQGNSDVDLLYEYTNLRPKLVYYGVSEAMENAVYDLFFYCGYATREYKIPSVDTRINFNFCQAEIVLNRFDFSEEIATEIRNKWKEGVTFFHYYNGTYDFNQQYENWESSFFTA